MKHRMQYGIFGVLLICFMTVSAGYGQEQEKGTSFVKLDSQGQQLPHNVGQWAMVRDNATGLTWEVKTTDGSIHDLERTFDWDSANKEFLGELNAGKFGGFSDWRLPTTDELLFIKVNGPEPFVNQEYFPNTVSTSYLSWRKCGSGEIFDERVKFGSIRNTKKDRRVRAVRSEDK